MKPFCPCRTLRCAELAEPGDLCNGSIRALVWATIATPRWPPVDPRVGPAAHIRTARRSDSSV